MKKLFLIFLALIFFCGCAHNEHMAAIEKERQVGYQASMEAWTKAVQSDPGKILELELESGKNLVVYNQKRSLPPMPTAPKEIKTWGAQVADSTSEFGVTAIKWGAGLMAIKFVTENSGDDVRDSYNDNRTSEQSSVDTQTDTSTIADSYNSDQQSTETNQEYADSYNTDGSINDGYNTDTNESINDSYGQDNRQEYGNDSRENYENDNSTVNNEPDN